MQSFSITPHESISLFVKDILIFEETEITSTISLPFYADGYPGLLYHETENGLVVSPHNKQMPLFFLYGQTIKPIELVLNGPFKLIVFQLYPFVVRSFFNVNPAEINDNCYDLSATFNNQLQQIKTNPTALQIEAITFFYLILFRKRKMQLIIKLTKPLQQSSKTTGRLQSMRYAKN